MINRPSGGNNKFKNLPKADHILKFIIKKFEVLYKDIELEYKTVDGRVNFVAAMIGTLIIVCCVFFDGFRCCFLAFRGVPAPLPNLYIIPFLPLGLFLVCIFIIRKALK